MPPQSLVFGLQAKTLILGPQTLRLGVVLVHRAVGFLLSLLLGAIFVHLVADEVSAECANTSADECPLGVAADRLTSVIFYGPPGTGKTLTASLLGQVTGHRVYKVDLAMVVSKYIGETEKNLATLFDKAENKNWILFFDEADSLFGKRTQVRDSHDRYANQEISYLLQRIEIFDGLVILASNLASNVDAAFSRRFEQIIHFPMPRKAERLQLWQKGLPQNITLESDIDLAQLASRHEISGGMIMNVIRHACMQAISRQQDILLLTDINEGIRRELAKENRLG